jgi:aryl-alcohol dehydrogenase-like predicted oxidoreductase
VASVTVSWACRSSTAAAGPVVVPIPGASRPETINDSAAAVDLVLSAAEFAALDKQDSA